MSEDLDLFGVGAYARAATRPSFSSTDCVEWRLRKNCSLAPSRLAACLTGAALPGLFAGLAFFALGAPMILAFLVLQFSTMAWCFLRYARHAADREWLTVSRGAIEVHIVFGETEIRKSFNPAAASMELLELQQNLIDISESGRSVQVGMSLPAHLRPQLFENLRHATRRFQ